MITAYKRVLSFTLCLALVFSCIPTHLRAYAAADGAAGQAQVAEDGEPAGDVRHILAFATPTQAVTVALGTSYGDLPLPEAVEATVEDQSTAQVPVDWEEDDEYDGDTAGSYGFTGRTGGGYSLADGVNPPRLTVTVAEEDSLVVIAGFDPHPYSNPDDPDTRYIVAGLGTPAGELPLPTTLRATAENGEENAYRVTVDRWECGGDGDGGQLAEGYDPDAIGIYLFAPILSLGDNEILAEGVTPPTVEVVVSENAPVAPLSSADQLADQINSWNHGGTGSLQATASGGTVTVEGQVEGAASGLSLEIDAGITVRWSADLSSESAWILLNLSGSGAFQLVSGSIENDMPALMVSQCAVSITGGTVTGGQGCAIGVLDGGTVIMTGGQVSSGNSFGAILAGGDGVVLATGGRVSANQGSSPAFGIDAGSRGVIGYVPSVKGTGGDEFLRGEGLISVIFAASPLRETDLDTATGLSMSAGNPPATAKWVLGDNNRANIEVIFSSDNTTLTLPIEYEVENVTPQITIETQPYSFSAAEGSINGTLNVAASATPAAELAYQWYESSSASGADSEEITGANTAAFQIPTGLVQGTYYYFCEVSALGATPVRSNVAVITVNRRLGGQTVAIEPPMANRTPQDTVADGEGYTGMEIRWFLSDGTEHTGPFALGVEYMARVTLRSETGYVWPGSPPVIAVDGGTVGNASVTGSTSGNRLTFDVTFPPVSTIYGLYVNGGTAYDTVAGAQAAIADALAVTGAVTVTGGLADAGETLTIQIPAGGRVEWQAEYAGAAEGLIHITGAGTMAMEPGGSISSSGSGYAVRAGGNTRLMIEDGVVENSSETAAAIQLEESSAAAVCGGAVRNGAGAAVHAQAGSTVYLSGSFIAYGGIRKEGSATGYYSGANGADAFHASFTPGSDLFRLDGAPPLTRETAGGPAYSHDPQIPYAGAVVASLPSGLLVDSVSISPTAGHAVDPTVGTVSFYGEIPSGQYAMDITGTLADGRIPVSFTTETFGLHLAKGSADDRITFEDMTVPYGGAYTPSVTTSLEGYTVAYSYTGVEGTSYGPSAVQPTDAGAYEVTATVQNDRYQGTKTARLTITPKPLTDSMVTVEAGPFSYSGSAHTPAVTVTDGGTSLIPGTDYDTAYGENTNVGAATVTVTGMGNYTGEINRGFHIEAANLSGATVTVTGSYIYTGGAHIPDAADVRVELGGIPLTPGSDYTVTADGNVDAGPASVHAHGAGNYTGVATGSFTIAQATAQSVSTQVDNVAMTAYEAREATTAQDVVDLAGLPSSLAVATDGAAATLPVTWVATDAYDAKGAVYNVTGILAGNSNVATGGLTASVRVEVTAVEAVNPTYSDALVLLDTGRPAATAAELGAGLLPTGGSITVEEEQIGYTVNWNGGETINLTAAGNATTFTGVITYLSPPAWLTLPANFTVSRKVTVTDKTEVAISASIPDRTYTGLPYVHSGATVAGGSVDPSALAWQWESTDGGGYSAGTPPTNAGAYKVTISVRDSDPAYFGSAAYLFRIQRAELEIRAGSPAVQAGAPLPPITIQYSTFQGGDDADTVFSTLPVARHTAADTAVAGDFPIIFTTQGVQAGANYNLTHTEGMLTVTALGTGCDVLAVRAPAGAAVSGTGITATVANTTAGLTVELEVSPGAVWALYRDAACTDRVADRRVQLAVGRNTCYVEVTAEDGVTVQVYTLEITRRPPEPEPRTYTVHVSASPAAGGTVTGGGSVVENSRHTVTARANTGYTFQNWTENGAVVSGSESYTFTVTGDRGMVANFTADGGAPAPGPNPGPGTQGGGGGSSSSRGGVGSATPDSERRVHKELSDSASGVRVSGYTAPGAVLSVNENTLHTEAGGCEACAAIREQRRAGNVLALYDISISGGYQGGLEVSIPVGGARGGETLTVLHCQNRELETRTLTVKDGYVTGTFATLSPFAVLQAQDAGSGGIGAGNTGETGGDDLHNPQTGDFGPGPWVWLAVLIPAAAVALYMGSLLLRRLRPSRG